jgi:hypothetical protein
MTEQQAAIVKATVAGLNPSGQSPDRPVVVNISTTGQYAITRWIWGIAAGDALLVNANGAWHMIDSIPGHYEAANLVQDRGISSATAETLVSPASVVEVGTIPSKNTQDQMSGRLGCGYAYKTYYRMNFPPNTKTTATEIVHANVFMYEGDAVGWLLRTRKGTQWYADGPIDVAQQHKAPEKVAIGVLYELVPSYNATLGTTPQDGSFWPVTADPNMAGITRLGIDVRNCF